VPRALLIVLSGMLLATLLAVAFLLGRDAGRAQTGAGNLLAAAAPVEPAPARRAAPRPRPAPPPRPPRDDPDPAPPSGPTTPPPPTPDQPLLHIHPDPAQIGRVFETTVRIVADTIPFLEALGARTPPDPSERDAWRDRLHTAVLDLTRWTPSEAPAG